VNKHLPRKGFEVLHEATTRCNDICDALIKQTRVKGSNNLLPSTGHQRHGFAACCHRATLILRLLIWKRSQAMGESNLTLISERRTKRHNCARVVPCAMGMQKSLIGMASIVVLTYTLRLEHVNSTIATWRTCIGMKQETMTYFGPRSWRIPEKMETQRQSAHPSQSLV